MSLGCWPWRTVNIIIDIGEEKIMTTWFCSVEEIKMCLLNGWSEWMTCNWEDLFWSGTLLLIFFVFRLTTFLMTYHFPMQKSELQVLTNTVLKIKCVFRLWLDHNEARNIYFKNLNHNNFWRLFTQEKNFQRINRRFNLLSTTKFYLKL